MIILPALEGVGQILLRHVVIRVLMGVLVRQPPPHFLGAGIVAVLQMRRDLAALAVAQVPQGGVNGADGRIGLRRGRQEDHRLAQRDPGLRQPQL